MAAELQKNEQKFLYLLETLSDMIAGYLDRQDIEGEQSTWPSWQPRTRGRTAAASVSCSQERT